PAGAHAGAGRVRLVRHSGLDRWAGPAHLLPHTLSRMADDARLATGRWSHGDRVDLVPPVLGTQHPGRLSWDGSLAKGRELGGAVCARDDGALGVVGACARARARAHPVAWW